MPLKGPVKVWDGALYKSPHQVCLLATQPPPWMQPLLTRPGTPSRSIQVGSSCRGRHHPLAFRLTSATWRTLAHSKGQASLQSWACHSYRVVIGTWPVADLWLAYQCVSVLCRLSLYACV